MDDASSFMDPRALGLTNAWAKVAGRTTGPKNQHYVTRAYQELFRGEDGLLAVYDRNTQKYFAVGRDGVAFENAFYVFTDDEGRQRYDVEHALQVFESKAIPVIKQLCQGAEIDAFERSMLAWYVAVSLVRTPQALDDLRRQYATLAPLLKDQFADEAAACAFYEEQGLAPRRAAERAAVIFGRAELKPGRQPSLGLMFEVLPWLYSRIERSRWLLLDSAADSGTFIISDCGVAQIAASRASYGNILSSEMQFVFPLSSTLCLVSIPADQPRLYYQAVERDQVVKINLITAWASRRHVMGPDMAQIKELGGALSMIPADWTPAFKIE